jgi:hypothetical protein
MVVNLSLRSSTAFLLVVKGVQLRCLFIRLLFSDHEDAIVFAKHILSDTMKGSESGKDSQLSMVATGTGMTASALSVTCTNRPDFSTLVHQQTDGGLPFI